MDIKESVLSIVNEIRQSKGLAKFEELSDSDRLREDFEFTSFDLAELTVKIEDEFDIDIFEDGLVSTVGEIFAKLEA